MLAALYLQKRPTYWLIWVGGHLPKGFSLRLLRLSLNLAWRARERALAVAVDRVRLQDIWETEGWKAEFDARDDDEAQHHSHKLRRRAQKLRIPLPAFRDEDGRLTSDYRRIGCDEYFYFSLAGEEKVRAAIHEAEMRLSERSSRKIPWITAVSGVAGTLVGFISAFAALSHHVN